MQKKSQSTLEHGLFLFFSLQSSHSRLSSVTNLSPCTAPRPNVINGSLTGFVWPIPIAFLLVFGGSVLGESLLFLSFRHFFHNRIVKFRKEHEENYGTIVLVINQHKRWMVFLIRLSAIPVFSPHLRILTIITESLFNSPIFLNR
jgi:hypothetical protein